MPTDTAAGYISSFTCTRKEHYFCNEIKWYHGTPFVFMLARGFFFAVILYQTGGKQNEFSALQSISNNEYAKQKMAEQCYNKGTHMVQRGPARRQPGT